MDQIEIGRIVAVEDLTITVAVISDVATSLTIRNGTNDVVVSLNALMCAELLSGKVAISKITRIYDKNQFSSEFFTKSLPECVVQGRLVGIFDRFSERYDSGVNSFPTIGTKVYAISREMYCKVLDINSPYALEIGNSYHFPDVSVSANPDILLGKHLAIIGNTGTGKTCSVASVIQGLRRRVSGSDENTVIRPKIIIFDSNNEYGRAFEDTEFSVLKVKKGELKLPHWKLNIVEYYKFLGASQGVQAPTLKAAIGKIKQGDGSFDFDKLQDAIVSVITDNANGNNFSFNQWFGWNAPLMQRIEQLSDDERFDLFFGTDGSNVEEILEGEEEVVLLDCDYDKDVLDIVIYLFSKLVYSWAQSKAESGEDRKCVVLVFEEAHRYISDEDRDDYKLGSFYIERLAREGRKFGISLIVSSQRPSELSKAVLAQCNSFIIHRIGNKADLEFIQKILSVDGRELLNVVPGLERQFALVVGEAFSSAEIVKMTTARPTPKSEDPKVVDSWIP